MNHRPNIERLLVRFDQIALSHQEAVRDNDRRFSLATKMAQEGPRYLDLNDRKLDRAWIGALRMEAANSTVANYVKF